jgi:malonyl-CoA decarboxylase
MVKELIRKPNLLNRTITALSTRTFNTWKDIIGVFSHSINPDLPDSDLQALKKLMNECLNNKGGEVLARKKTVELGHYYLQLSHLAREKFLKLLADKFDINRSALKKSLSNYLDLVNKNTGSLALEAEIREALEPPRTKILRQFSALPNGIKFLVDMRSDLLSYKKKDPELSGLEADLRRLLTSWFDIGLLDMREINWHSSASLLEKLIAYEAVHKISSWNDLKNRLDADRKCFAFFHYKMPDEPLIFVEVALLSGMPNNIQDLLDVNAASIDPAQADSAIFYSISNAQNGLSSISFGNFLIKRVVEKLSSEYKLLKHFVTLSPIPGFRYWLDHKLQHGDESVFTTHELKLIKNYSKGQTPPCKIIHELITSHWTQDKAACDLLQKILMRICAHYLVHEKKHDKALDPVANFHLSNGARIERLNFLSDTSHKGLSQSCGMMVNYYYNLSEIDANYEKYTVSNLISFSSSIKSLLKE